MLVCSFFSITEEYTLSKLQTSYNVESNICNVKEVAFLSAGNILAKFKDEVMQRRNTNCLRVSKHTYAKST